MMRSGAGEDEPWEKWRNALLDANDGVMTFQMRDHGMSGSVRAAFHFRCDSGLELSEAGRAFSGYVCRWFKGNLRC